MYIDLLNIDHIKKYVDRKQMKKSQNNKPAYYTQSIGNI